MVKFGSRGSALSYRPLVVLPISPCRTGFCNRSGLNAKLALGSLTNILAAVKKSQGTDLYIQSGHAGVDRTAVIHLFNTTCDRSRRISTSIASEHVVPYEVQPAAHLAGMMNTLFRSPTSHRSVGCAIWYDWLFPEAIATDSNWAELLVRVAPTGSRGATEPMTGAHVNRCRALRNGVLVAANQCAS